MSGLLNKSIGLIGEIRKWGERRFQKQANGDWKQLSDKHHDVKIGDSYGEEAGLDVSRYSDKAILIKGTTYANLALIRGIKDEVGVGVWNKTLNGWIFPVSVKDTVLGLLASHLNHHESETAEDQKIQDNSVALKNSVDEGTPVQVGPHEGEDVGIVVDKQLTETGLEYRVETEDGTKIVEVKQVEVLPSVNAEKVAAKLSQATPENRVKTTTEVFGKPEEKPVAVYNEIIHTKEFVTFSGERVIALDLTHVQPIELQWPGIDGILTKPKPTYFPDINEEMFSWGTRNQGFTFSHVRVGDDQYLVFLNGGKEVSHFNKSNVINDKAVMSLDNLVALTEYYRLKHKAKLQAKADEKTRRAEEYYDKQTPEVKEKYLGKFPWEGLSANTKKKVTKEEWDKMTVPQREVYYKPVRKYGAERMKLSEEGAIQRVNFDLYQKYVDQTYKPPVGRTYDGRTDKAGIEFNEVASYLQHKRVDMRTQSEEASGSYKKGVETSFGDTNVDTSLLKSMGVKIKAQDGKKLDVQKAEQIKTALGQVYSSFGDRSQMSEKFGLKISHAGEKKIFASDFLGLYHPQQHAIAVSAHYGEGKFGFTLAHEFAHFIDNYAGKQRGRHFASDDYKSLAGQIAFTFRSNMNQKSDSDYTNRTAECFARAFEQYHAISTSGLDAQHVHKKYVDHENFVNADIFQTKMKPMIEQFLKENNEILKAESGLELHG